MFMYFVRVPGIQVLTYYYLNVCQNIDLIINNNK